MVTPKPETEEYNVSSFIYTRHRPFHPRRLFSLLHDKFILQMEHPGEEDEMDQDSEDEESAMEIDEPTSDCQSALDSDSRSSTSATSQKSSMSSFEIVPSPKRQVDEDALDVPSNEVILANKRAHPTFRRLFRSKGEFLLATRPHRAGDWSQAGAMLTLTGGRAWFCTLDPEEYTTGDAEVDSLVQHDIQKGGEWGDRRQELVFIGEKLDHAHLESLLDECLLTDADMQQWESAMRKHGADKEKLVDAMQDLFDDGFPDWAEDDEDEDEDEDEQMDDGEETRHNHRHKHGHKHQKTLA